MNRVDVDWHGVFVPLITPFTEDEKIDEQAYRRLVELSVSEDRVHGIIACGSAGEFYVLDVEERERLYRITVEEVAGRVPVLAGTSAISPRDVIVLTQRAARAGVDGVMILPPYYALPMQREVIEFFREISATTPLPIMVYNGPRRTGVNLVPEVIERLADVERVVAVKESSQDFLQITSLLEKCGDRVRIFTGWETMFLGSLALGADGVVAVATPALGPVLTELYEAMSKGEMGRARSLQRFVGRFYDVFGAGSEFAVLKEAVTQVGRPGGLPRRPLLPLTHEERAVVRGILAELGLLDGQRR